MRMSRLLITLPLIAASTLTLGPRAVWAAVAPVEALELLTKSKVSDQKCNILRAGERDELSGYAARAEVAVSQTVPLSDVQDAVANGRMLGGHAACDAATAREISETLAAARRAMAAVNKEQTRRNKAREMPIPGRSLASADSAPVPVRRRGGDLETYGREAMAYYVERRCTYLAGHNTRDFYNRIVRRHQAALGTYGGAAVSAVVRRAEANAAEVSCGQGRELVAGAYSEIRR
ncbi:hypothetical protein BH10PSE7_BH10PSE7_01550 [soil metagenome]